MKHKISISDFAFYSNGYGAYIVYYISPVTHKSYSARITDMTIIDATKNAEEPKVKDLEMLKRICKS